MILLCQAQCSKPEICYLLHGILKTELLWGRVKLALTDGCTEAWSCIVSMCLQLLSVELGLGLEWLEAGINAEFLETANCFPLSLLCVGVSSSQGPLLPQFTSVSFWNLL